MASDKLLELLNEAIARELQVSIQYMWQQVTAKGVNKCSNGSFFPFCRPCGG